MESKYSKQILDALNELVKKKNKSNEKLDLLLDLNTNLLDVLPKKFNEVNSSLGNISSMLDSIGAKYEKRVAPESSEPKSESSKPKVSDTYIIIDAITKLHSESLLLSASQNTHLEHISNILKNGFPTLASVLAASNKSASIVIPNIKQLGNMKADAIQTKIQQLYAKLRKGDKSGEKSDSSSETQVGDISENLKGLSTFLTDFIKAATLFASDVKGKLKPEDIPMYITKIYTEITKELDIKTIEHSSQVFESVEGVLKGIDSFTSEISAKTYPNILMANKLNIGKALAKIVLQISKKLASIKQAPAQSNENIQNALTVLSSMQGFSMNVPKVYGQLVLATTFPVGKLFAILIKQTVKSLSKIDLSTKEEALSAALRGIEIINSIEDVTKKLQDTNNQVLAVITLRMGSRVVFMLKSIISKLNKLESISSETKANIDYVKSFLANDVQAISSSLFMANIYLTLMQKNKVISKLQYLLYGTFNMFEILGKSKVLLDSSKRKEVFESLTKIGGVLLTFIKDVNELDKKLGSVRKREKFKKKIDNLNAVLKSAIEMFDSVVKEKANIKIAAENLEQISHAIKGLSSMTFILALIAPITPIAKIGLYFIASVLDSFEHIGKKSKKIKKGGQALKYITYSLALFTLTAAAFAVVSTKILPGFLVGMGMVGLAAYTFFIIGAGQKRIRKASKAIAWMSLSLALFGLGTFILAASVTKNPIGIIAGLALLGLTALTFFIIGKNKRPIAWGILVTMAMGLGLAVFALGVGFLGIALKNYDWEKFGMAMAMLAGSALIFGLIGKFGKLAIKGALIVAIMGLALIPFSWGVGALGKAIKKWTWDSLLMAMATLGGIALIMGIIGAIGKQHVLIGAMAVAAMGLALLPFAWGAGALGKAIAKWDWDRFGMAMALLVGTGVVFSLIGAAGNTGLPFIGAAAVAAIGLSLIPFAWGVNALGKAKMLSSDEILNFALLMGTLTVGYSALGLASILVIPGAIAATAMGLSLQQIGIAVEKASKVRWESFPIDSVKEVLIGLASAFAAVGADGNSGVMGFVTGMLNVVGLGPNNVSKGIKSVLGAAEALKSVAMGVKFFDSLTRGLNFDVIEENGQFKPAPDSIPFRMTTVLGAINKVFSEIGASGNTNDSLIGFVFGSDFKQADTEVGIKAVFKAGKALKSVAQGVKDFAAMTSGLDFSTDSDRNPLPSSVPYRMATVLGVINKVFSDIGASGNTNKSLVGLVFGSDFKKSDTEVGINSVLNAGKALKAVAQGVKDFEAMTKDLNFDTEGDGKPLPESVPFKITTVLGVINKVFSDIGASGNTNKSLVGLIFGSDFKKSDTEVGINSVLNAGAALTSVADGVKAFDSFSEDMNFDPDDEDSIQNKITKVLGTISAVFAGIGKQKGGGDVASGFLNLLTGIDLRGNLVEEGIEAVQGVGQVFVDIAEGLKQWNDLDQAGYDMQAITDNITLVLTSISSVFAKIGEMDNSDIFSDGDVTNGIEAIQGVGAEFQAVAAGIKTFGDLQQMGFSEDAFNPNIPGSLTNNMIAIITSIAKVFGEIGKGDVFDDDEVSAGIESIQGVGGEFEKIAKSVKIFGSISKDEIDLDAVRKSMKDVILTIAQVFTEVGQDEDKLDAAESGIEAIQGIGKELEAISKSLKPYMDLQKGETPIDVNKVKQNIRDLVVSSVDTIAYIAKTYDEDDIEDGRDVITEALDAFKSMGEISKSITSFDGDVTLPLINIKKIVTENVQLVAEIGKTYDEDDIEVGKDIIEEVVDIISSINEIAEKIHGFDNEKGSVIKTLTEDVGDFLHLVQTHQVPSVKKKSFDEIINFLERVAKITDPFEQFTENFKNHVGDVKDYINEINTISQEPFEQFIELNKQYVELGKIETSKLFENLDAIKNHVDNSTTIAQSTSSFGSQIGNIMSNIFGSQSRNISSSSSNNTTVDNTKELNEIKESINALKSLMETAIVGGVMQVNEV